MACRVYQFKADARAMPARREPAALDHRDLVGHVLVDGVMRDSIHAALRHDLAGVKFLRHRSLHFNDLLYVGNRPGVTYVPAPQLLGRNSRIANANPSRSPKGCRRSKAASG